jgi:hypothetical protein
VTKVIEGDGFTLVLSEKLGKIEVKKISKVIDGAAVILVITPAGNQPLPKGRGFLK